MKTTLSVSSKGQVTIPKKVREKLGFKLGVGNVSYEVTKGGVLLKPLKRPEDFVGTMNRVFPQDAVAAVRSLRDDDRL